MAHRAEALRSTSSRQRDGPHPPLLVREKKSHRRRASGAPRSPSLDDQLRQAVHDELLAVPEMLQEILAAHVPELLRHALVDYFATHMLVQAPLAAQHAASPEAFDIGVDSPPSASYTDDRHVDASCGSADGLSFEASEHHCCEDGLGLQSNRATKRCCALEVWEQKHVDDSAFGSADTTTLGTDASPESVTSEIASPIVLSHSPSSDEASARGGPLRACIRKGAELGDFVGDADDVGGRRRARSRANGLRAWSHERQSTPSSSPSRAHATASVPPSTSPSWMPPDWSKTVSQWKHVTAGIPDDELRHLRDPQHFDISSEIGSDPDKMPEEQLVGDISTVASAAEQSFHSSLEYGASMAADTSYCASSWSHLDGERVSAIKRLRPPSAEFQQLYQAAANSGEHPITAITRQVRERIARIQYESANDPYRLMYGT